MKFLSIPVALLVLGACTKEAPKEPVQPEPTSQPAAAAAAPVLPTTIEEAVASPTRKAENRERDAHRHPVETLTFFGLKPDARVLEISPGRGWYAEILAPYLSSKGHYIAGLVPDNGNEYLKTMNSDFQQWVASRPELKVETVTFTPGAPIAVSEPVDMILTFRNLHNWMGQGKEKETFAAFFKALKPGGILGVTEHRGDPKKPQDPKAKSGYVREDYVIKIAKQAGFKLEEKSEINANPKDTKDYKDGVWTLPPTFRLKDQDKDKYAAIGESDRMTLRFAKPVKK